MPSSPATVLVVGAGVVGIACAHYLSRAGFTVLVIDQGRVGGGCSHGNTGQILPSHVLPLTEPGALREGLRSLFRPGSPLKVRPQLRASMYAWLWQFARHCTWDHMRAAAGPAQRLLDSAMREYRQAVLAEAGVDAEWQANGLLYVLRTPRGMDAFAREDEMLQAEFGVAASRLDGDALTDFDPSLKEGLAGGFHYPGDANVRPDVLLRNWASSLRRNGVKVLEKCRLNAVRTEGGSVKSLDTARGALVADHYVIAAGAWTGRLAKALGCRIPVEPGKGYSITTTSPARKPAHPMAFPEHRVAVTPFKDALRVGSMLEFCGFDDRLRPRRIRQLARSAMHYLTEPVGSQTLETWCGWRPVTPDSLPIIGPVPGLDNAVLATGHHMLGMSMAPATGRLVAELLAGETPHIDPAPFSPARFGRSGR